MNISDFKPVFLVLGGLVTKSAFSKTNPIFLDDFFDTKLMTGFKLMVTLQSGCVPKILTLCRMDIIFFLKIPGESSRAELSNDV